MNEDYKLCPYCNNAVDKKDKECPYCLKPLTRRSSTNDRINNIINNEINRDSGIKDNKSGNSFEIPPLFQKLFDVQKTLNGGKNADSEITKKVRKFSIIFILLMWGIPFIIGIIVSIFGE